MNKQLKLAAPFPYFGGKSRVAGIVWSALGDVTNYVEPFFGSGAVLLARETPVKTETVNDKSGFIANFWRAIREAPDAVAHYADMPVNECDLHAIHWRLVKESESLSERLMADIDYYDAKLAGWWVWGACSWIGSGWCSGEGPWQSNGLQLVKPDNGDAGVQKKRPHLGNRGQGINKQLPHLGDRGQFILEWFTALSDRLRDTRVCCGDWSRVVGNSPTILVSSKTGIFLDPPYVKANRADKLYEQDEDCALDVLRWCVDHDSDPRLRIVLAGYTGDYDELAERGWSSHNWKAPGGFANQGDQRGRENAHKEILWFSPHCEAIQL